MNFIIVKTNSININNVVEDNKGMFSIQRKGDTVLIHAKSVGLQFTGTAADFQCDGQVFDNTTDLHNWLSENLFYNGGGSGEGLQKASLEDVQDGENDSEYVTPLVLNEFIDWRVSALLREDPTGTPLSVQTLNTRYPNAQLRTVIDAFNIQMKYTKLAEDRWEAMPYAVAPATN